MDIINTIIPIFVVIILGGVIRKRGFIPETFLGRANQLVYYVAIPAMIFRAISKLPLESRVNFRVVGITLVSLMVVTGLSGGIGWIAGIKKRQRGTFMQGSFHGNLGYIAFAVSFYYLGEEGLSRTSIIAAFVMILQNFLAVVSLRIYSADTVRWKSGRDLFLKVFGSPVIFSAVAGILFSLSGLPLPVIIARSLDIVSSMALPLALLIIGASLSFSLFRSQFREVIIAVSLKLLALPGIGYLLYRYAALDPVDCLPGIIILASPTATIAYVMAKELRGDPELSIVIISVSTLISAVTMSLWLMVF